VKRVNNKAILNAQNSVDEFVQDIEDSAEKLKDHLAEIAVQEAFQDKAELQKHVRAAFDEEYKLTGDTQFTSRLLADLKLNEEDFIDEE
jgi:hypothetical protein